VRLALLTALVCSTAFAEGSRNVASLPVLSLLAGGVSVQGERYFLDDRWSFALALGGRASAAGDYGSLKLSVSAEARRWLGHSAPLAVSGDGALGGPFLWARVDGAWTRLEQRGQGMLGAMVSTAQGIGLGYRLLPWWHFELTPTLGIDATQVDTARFLETRLVLALGFALGYVF
jgi:hypothetical protein